MRSDFTGFSLETIRFYYELKLNNDRPWFEENKSRFQSAAIEPAQRFVEAIGERLASLAPGVVADPRINKSIFRIYRDIRYSKDKRPYKTHLSMIFWEGPLKKMENPGFYLQINPESLFIGAGLHIFSKTVLETFRESVADDKTGPELETILADLHSNSTYRIGGEQYKRIPRGFPADHPRADLLRYKGIYAYVETPHPREMFTAEFPDYCFRHYAELAPLHQWMKRLVDRAAGISD